MTYAHMIYYFQMFFTSKCVFSPKVAALFDSLLLPLQYYSFHGKTSCSKSYSFHGRTTTPSELSTLLLGAQLLEQEEQSQKKITFFNNLSFFSKTSLFKKQRGQQSTSKTKFSHLTYYIYVCNFLHCNSISKTQAHLMYYFKHYSLQNVFFHQKSLLLLPVLDYHSSTKTPSKL